MTKLLFLPLAPIATLFLMLVITWAVSFRKPVINGILHPAEAELDQTETSHLDSPRAI